MNCPPLCTDRLRRHRSTLAKAR